MVAILPDAGWSKAEPTIISGASVRTWASATTLRKRSPSGATPIWFRARSVSIARISSERGIGRSMMSVYSAVGSAAGRRMLRPVWSSSADSTPSMGSPLILNDGIISSPGGLRSTGAFAPGGTAGPGPGVCAGRMRARAKKQAVKRRRTEREVM